MTQILNLNESKEKTKTGRTKRTNKTKKMNFTIKIIVFYNNRILQVYSNQLIIIENVNLTEVEARAGQAHCLTGRIMLTEEEK